MDSSAVSLAGGAGAPTPAPAPRAVPSGQAEPPSEPFPWSGHGVSDAEFLASQALGQSGKSGPALRDTYARFVVDPNTHDVHVEIVDAAKQQIIRTIPGDDLRRMAQEYRASQGFVVNSAV